MRLSEERKVFYKKMLICIFAGFSSGLPLFFFLSLLPIWLRSDVVSINVIDMMNWLKAVPNLEMIAKPEFLNWYIDSGYAIIFPYMPTHSVDLRQIGLFSLLQLPYTLKFLWAPLLDRYSLSFLGRRRSWIFAAQIGLLLVMMGYAWLNPSRDMNLVVVLSILLTFFSATQDIAIDAFRREILTDDELGLGNSIHVTAYRMAVLIPGSLSLILADRIDWYYVFIFTALFMLPGMLMVLFSQEPKTQQIKAKGFIEMVVDPLKEFINRKGVKEFLLVVLFIILYKLGDSLATALSSVFYLDIGYSMTHIGGIAKYSQLIAGILGGLIGGVLMLKIGINKGLWLFGIVQILSILGFIWLASFGKFAVIGVAELVYLASVIAFEYLGVGLGTAAFVAFMARESNPLFAATQIALLTAISSIPRTFVNSISGWLAEGFGFYIYFWICFFLAIPGMLLLFLVAPWDTSKTAKIEPKNKEELT